MGVGGGGVNRTRVPPLNPYPHLLDNIWVKRKEGLNRISRLHRPMLYISLEDTLNLSNALHRFLYMVPLRQDSFIDEVVRIWQDRRLVDVFPPRGLGYRPVEFFKQAVLDAHILQQLKGEAALRLLLR